MKLKTVRNILLSLIVVFAAGFIGYSLGKRNFYLNFQSSSNKLINLEEPADKKDIDFSLFWDVWDKLERNYIDKSKLNPQEMVYGAISGMVASLGDPYTIFLPPQEQKEAKEELGGTFEGIGAELGMKDKKIIVVAPLKDMPADKAGIKKGDWIVKVDGSDTVDWTVLEAVNKIRGPQGTAVVLTVLHDGEDKTQDLSITRGNIIVKSVEWEKVYWTKTDTGYKKEDNCLEDCLTVAYLRLSRFGDQTNKEWSQAVTEIADDYKNGSIKGVILDLRNNPGGYLQGAVFIASEFLKENLIVVQQQYFDSRKETYSVLRKGGLLDIPLVVLINKGSASASEIVAGALRDYGRAQLVGETSFGKGSIQEAQDLPGGAGLHITIAKWLLPKGDWINGKGVTPTIEVSLDENNPTLDTQLEAAANVILK